MNQRQINVLRAMWLRAQGSAREQEVIAMIRRAVRENKNIDSSFDTDAFIQKIVGK